MANKKVGLLSTEYAARKVMNEINKKNKKKPKKKKTGLVQGQVTAKNPKSIKKKTPSESKAALARAIKKRNQRIAAARPKKKKKDKSKGG